MRNSPLNFSPLQVLRRLMLDCWNAVPDVRPSFEEVGFLIDSGFTLCNDYNNVCARLKRIHNDIKTGESRNW